MAFIPTFKLPSNIQQTAAEICNNIVAQVTQDGACGFEFDQRAQMERYGFIYDCIVRKQSIAMTFHLNGGKVVSFDIEI